MKTDLHHGLNLAVIRYRLLEWMANLRGWGLKQVSGGFAQCGADAASRLHSFKIRLVLICMYIVHYRPIFLGQ